MTIFKSNKLPFHPALSRYTRENWAIQFDDGSRLYGAWDKQDLINKVAVLDLPDLIVMPD